MAKTGDPPDTTAPKDQTRSGADWAVDRCVASLIALGRALPVPLQRRLSEGLARIAFARQKDQAQAQLDTIFPALSADQRHKIARSCVANIIRGTLEIADSTRLLRRAEAWVPQGDGLAVLEAARAEGRPVILVTGHFGNWEAARAALTCRGHVIGGLYRPLNNGYLDDRWKRILSSLSGPVFPRGRQGLRGLLRHLKEGGVAVMLPDQFMFDGAILDFLGQPAPTSVAAADLALRMDAPLIPFYGIRRGDGFEVVLEAPIKPGDPNDMMQAVNDSLAARIHATPEQWLWVHRRWKPGRLKRRMAED